MRKSEEEENREFWGSKQTLQKLPPGFLSDSGTRDLEFGSGIALDPFWAPFLAWVGWGFAIQSWSYLPLWFSLCMRKKILLNKNPWMSLFKFDSWVSGSCFWNSVLLGETFLNLCNCPTKECHLVLFFKIRSHVSERPSRLLTAWLDAGLDALCLPRTVPCGAVCRPSIPCLPPESTCAGRPKRKQGRTRADEIGRRIQELGILVLPCSGEKLWMAGVLPLGSIAQLTHTFCSVLVAGAAEKGNASWQCPRCLPRI